ncbi:hypothetical protein EYC80_007769 [Monilinia laxa]|uniref:Uncharacterized protein n=1 Tax=Monilinia laxa TaxID=61186 RepID=A0A5N6JWY4_MONLA|nr:hypothetical protein EYC80_007769 [Monilinia laxa]
MIIGVPFRQVYTDVLSSDLSPDIKLGSETDPSCHLALIPSEEQKRLHISIQSFAFSALDWFCVRTFVVSSHLTFDVEVTFKLFPNQRCIEPRRVCMSSAHLISTTPKILLDSNREKENVSVSNIPHHNEQEFSLFEESEIKVPIRNVNSAIWNDIFFGGMKYLPYAGSHQYSMVCDLFKCKKIDSRPITHRGFLSRHHHVGGGSDGPYIYGLHFLQK